jgi:hypothetical protein
MIAAIPLPLPVTLPDALTTAINVLPDVHAPPVTELANSTDCPWQMVVAVVGVIGASVFTVTVTTLWQPVLSM